MNPLKPLISLILLATLALTPTAHATPPSPPTLAVHTTTVDDTLTVAVTLTDFTDLYDFHITLTWNATILTLTHTEHTPHLDRLWSTTPPGWLTIINTTTPDAYTLVATNLGPEPGATSPATQSLFTLTFHVDAAGATTLTFTTAKLCDSATPIPNPITPHTIHGTYTTSPTTPQATPFPAPARGGPGPKWALHR